MGGGLLRQSCCEAPVDLEFSAILFLPLPSAGLLEWDDTTPDYIDLTTRKDCTLFYRLKKFRATFHPTRTVHYTQMPKAIPNEELGVDINSEIEETPAFQSFLEI